MNYCKGILRVAPVHTEMEPMIAALVSFWLAMLARLMPASWNLYHCVCRLQQTRSVQSEF
jgi:hypothetical protein